MNWSLRTPARVRGPKSAPLVSGVMLLAATTASATAVLLPAPQPLHAMGGIALTAFLPGVAIARRLLSTEKSRPSDQLLRVVVAVALSLATTVAASLGLLYLEQWSWQRSILLLATVTAAASIPDVLRGRLPWRPSA